MSQKALISTESAPKTQVNVSGCLRILTKENVTDKNDWGGDDMERSNNQCTWVYWRS